jgi:hypothetical protein
MLPSHNRLEAPSYQCLAPIAKAFVNRLVLCATGTILPSQSVAGGRNRSHKPGRVPHVVALAWAFQLFALSLKKRRSGGRWPFFAGISKPLPLRNYVSFSMVT